MIRGPRGTGPLPDIAGNVIKPETVGRESFHRCRPVLPRRQVVLEREATVPGIGHDPPARHEFISPRVRRLVQPAAGGVLPLGLAGQPLACPAGVSNGILESDVDYGMQ